MMSNKIHFPFQVSRFGFRSLGLQFDPLISKKINERKNFLLEKKSKSEENSNMSLGQLLSAVQTQKASKYSRLICDHFSQEINRKKLKMLEMEPFAFFIPLTVINFLFVAHLKEELKIFKHTRCLARSRRIFTFTTKNFLIF